MYRASSRRRPPIRLSRLRLLVSASISLYLFCFTIFSTNNNWIRKPYAPLQTFIKLKKKLTWSLRRSSTDQAQLQIPRSQPVPDPDVPCIPGLPNIPAKIWQSAKSENLSMKQKAWSSTWLEKNPSFEHELVTDDTWNQYVEKKYGTIRPDIVSLFKGLQVAILKADLLRYLILLADGGIWSDIDATCAMPVADWLPADANDVMFAGGNVTSHTPWSEGIGLIVGLEFDGEWEGEGSGLSSQLTNWVFAARPGSRHLQLVVDDIVRHLNDITLENGVTAEGITLDMISDVVEVTGPWRMTLGILESLSCMLGRRVDERDFSRGKKPRVLGDVVIMPGNAFAAKQNGYPTGQGPVLVTHHYEGSWKSLARQAKDRRRRKMMETEARRKTAD
ncbi:hypothetical protein GX48_01420 [Paracoccidioides brasiliensis]|nr:hypothetical protein GX48_01420 [Paracoccidioides brasiliensis]